MTSWMQRLYLRDTNGEVNVGAGNLAIPTRKYQRCFNFPFPFNVALERSSVIPVIHLASLGSDGYYLKVEEIGVAEAEAIIDSDEVVKKCGFLAFFPATWNGSHPSCVAHFESHKSHGRQGGRALFTSNHYLFPNHLKEPPSDMHALPTLPLYECLY